MKNLLRFIVTIVLAVAVQPGFASEQIDYERQVGGRLVTLHQTLDRNADAAVSREEAGGDLNFLPLFEDMDVNRDGFVTRDELRGYLERRYGPHAAEAVR